MSLKAGSPIALVQETCIGDWSYACLECVSGHHRCAAAADAYNEGLHTGILGRLQLIPQAAPTNDHKRHSGIRGTPQYNNDSSIRPAFFNFQVQELAKLQCWVRGTKNGMFRTALH